MCLLARLIVLSLLNRLTKMNVVVFDGVCNLCNGAVNWIIDHDKNNRFRFSSLQSDYGKQIVAKYNLQQNYMDTFILVEDEQAYIKSTAALRVLKGLGGFYKLAYASIIIPRFIRDAVYNFIARNRYRWFGKRESCRMPTPELKAKFIQ